MINLGIFAGRLIAILRIHVMIEFMWPTPVTRLLQPEENCRAIVGPFALGRQVEVAAVNAHVTATYLPFVTREFVRDRLFI